MKALKIIGIEIRTSNENGVAIEDLGKLWGQFFSENIASKIPNKISDNIYAVYTDYESDYKGKYTTIIGCEVDKLDNIPDGLIGREFASQKSKTFLAKGEIHKAVGETWSEIWEKDKEGKPKLPNRLLLVTETNLAQVFKHIEDTKPTLVIVDSIQTMTLPDMESAAGSISQVRECAARLRELAKSSGVTVFLIGHVTKEGTIE